MIDDKNQKEQLEKAYYICEELNESIIYFAELLFENYNNDNKKWYNNIIRNTTFNTNKLIDEDVTHAINYFNSFHFIKYKEIKTVIAHYQ